MYFIIKKEGNNLDDIIADMQNYINEWLVKGYKCQGGLSVSYNEKNNIFFVTQAILSPDN